MRRRGNKGGEREPTCEPEPNFYLACCRTWEEDKISKRNIQNKSVCTGLLNEELGHNISAEIKARSFLFFFV